MAKPERALAGEAAEGPPILSPVVLMNAGQWDQTSRATGRQYRIFVTKPPGPPPPGGYPVFYMSDGNQFFGCAQVAARTRMLLGELRVGLIVGSGYPTMEAAEINGRRMFELTPPAPADYIIVPGLTRERWQYGGADAFLDFVLDEVEPRVAQLYPIDRNDRSLFGDSAGAILAVHALFTRPRAFRSFIAASPSVFFNNGSVFAHEPAFAERVRAGEVSPRVLITVGALEQSVEDLACVPLAMPDRTPERALAQANANRMVDNARELAARLKGLGLEVEFAEFEDETHCGVVLPNISRGVRFAFRA